MPVMTGTALNNLSYDDLVRWVRLSSGHNDYLDKYIIESAKYGVSEIEAVEDMASTYMNFYKDGNGAYTITSFNSDAQITAVNPVDSNIGTISRGNVQTPLNRAKDAVTNKLNFSTTPASGSFAQNAAYFLGSVGQAVGCASVGITLGKNVEGALYNANPDFWDSLGLWSINPEKWATISNGEDSWQAGLFNFIYGIDPDTGNGQLYMDENAFAYMAYAMAQNGIFNIPQTTTQVDQETYSALNDNTLPNNFPCSQDNAMYNEADGRPTGSQYPRFAAITSSSSPVYLCNLCVPVSGATDGACVYVGTIAASWDNFTYRVTNASGSQVSSGSANYAVVNDEAFYWVQTSGSAGTRYYPLESSPTWVSVGGYSSAYQSKVAYLLIKGTKQEAGGVDGISNQEGATQPNISDWDTIPDTLSSLQNQYPDLWNNPLVWDNYQPDGTNPQKVYIPVATPNSTTGTNTQPISSNSTQTNPQINPDTSTQALIDFLTNVMTQPNPQTNPQTQEETDTQPKIPPSNPVDTGTGETPTPLPPVGSASALWSVYHPTQAQVNSFGAWLWGSPFLTNIGKLFQNPIEGVISLHKVFVTPINSGSGTIVVGTLDSGVSSATVNEQYIEVDCGSIDCYEEFGNVFDYDPYTKIALYLPFVGIVPLNVGDIMRSTISVKYGVDIFTGACIAMVDVSRDGNNATLYQYSGNCAVHYPLSNVQQSQLLSGLITVAAGIGAIVATGGAAAPAAATGIASGAMSALHTNIGRSGGFSANSGAMGIKVPYLIIERPQTKIAETFPELAGYPTNYSCKLNECSGHVVVKHVHIEGINATDSELDKINNLLMSGVIV